MQNSTVNNIYIIQLSITKVMMFIWRKNMHIIFLRTWSIFYSKVFAGLRKIFKFARVFTHFPQKSYRLATVGGEQLNKQCSIKNESAVNNLMLINHHSHLKIMIELPSPIKLIFSTKRTLRTISKRSPAAQLRSMAKNIS